MGRQDGGGDETGVGGEGMQERRDGGETRVGWDWCDCGAAVPQAVDVQMQSMTLRGPDGEPQPGLESQGRAASMPRLAAETQVGVWEVGVWEGRAGG